ncbi:hypothetical protein AAAC51_12545 [Priestia megaterium]
MLYSPTEKNIIGKLQESVNIPVIWVSKKTVIPLINTFSLNSHTYALASKWCKTCSHLSVQEDL